MDADDAEPIPPTSKSRKRPSESNNKQPPTKKTAPEFERPRMTIEAIQELSAYSDTFAEIALQSALQDADDNYLQPRPPPKPLFVRTVVGPSAVGKIVVGKPSSSIDTTETWPGAVLGRWPPPIVMPLSSTSEPPTDMAPPIARTALETQRRTHTRNATKLYGPPISRPKAWPKLHTWFSEVVDAFREDRPIRVPLLCIAGPPGVGKSYAVRWMAHAHNVAVIDFDVRSDDDERPDKKSSKPKRRNTIDNDDDSNKPEVRMDARLRLILGTCVQMNRRPTILLVRDAGGCAVSFAVRIANIAAWLSTKKQSAALVLSMLESEAYDRSKSTSRSAGPPNVRLAFQQSPYAEWIPLYRAYSNTAVQLAKQWIAAAHPHIPSIRQSTPAALKTFNERSLPRIVADARGDLRQVVFGLVWHFVMPLSVDADPVQDDVDDDSNRIHTSLDAANWLAVRRSSASVVGWSKPAEIVETLGIDAARQVVEYYLSWIFGGTTATTKKNNTELIRARTDNLYLLMLEAKRAVAESKLDPETPESYLNEIRRNVRLDPKVIAHLPDKRLYISLVADILMPTDDDIPSETAKPDKSAVFADEKSSKPRSSTSTNPADLTVCSALLDMLADSDCMSYVPEVEETIVCSAVRSAVRINLASRPKPTLAESIRWLYPRYRYMPASASSYPPPDRSDDGIQKQ